MSYLRRKCLRKKKAGKRKRESPPTAPKTHSVAMTTARDAIVAFGAGHGVLSVPVERRIARYLDCTLSVVPMTPTYSLDVEAGARDMVLRLFVVSCGQWAVVAMMSHFPSILGAVGCRTCEHLDHATNTWVQGPDMSIDRCFLGVSVHKRGTMGYWRRVRR